MSVMLSRYGFLRCAAMFAMAVPALAQANALYGSKDASVCNPELLPPPESPVDSPVRPANLRKILAEFRKQLVSYPTPEFPGTHIIDPDSHHLYLIRENNEAVRYGVRVGVWILPGRRSKDRHEAPLAALAAA
jgi:lipoprotein-anchoring transpeptidase ErfK/SrfK